MAKVASRPSVVAEALVTSKAGGTAASGLAWMSWAWDDVASAPCMSAAANVPAENLMTEKGMEYSN
jgi:hypothetical protein